jgi:hypothetical protein
MTSFIASILAPVFEINGGDDRPKIRPLGQPDLPGDNHIGRLT